MESVSQSILKLLIFLDTVQWLSKAQAGDPVKTLRKVGLKTSTPDLGSDTVSESGSSGVGKWKGVSYTVCKCCCQRSCGPAGRSPVGQDVEARVEGPKTSTYWHSGKIGSQVLCEAPSLSQKKTIQLKVGTGISPFVKTTLSQLLFLQRGKVESNVTTRFNILPLYANLANNFQCTSLDLKFHLSTTSPPHKTSKDVFLASVQGAPGEVW